jgi:hypothetical protein
MDQRGRKPVVRLWKGRQDSNRRIRASVKTFMNIMMIIFEILNEHHDDPF